MGWRTLYFGKENPTRGHRIAIHSIVAVLALAVYGYWNDFIPDDWLPWWGLVASAILAALLTGWLAWLNISGRNPRYTGGAAMMLLLSPLVFLIFGGFFWMALVHGAAGAYTRLFGMAHTEVAALRVERRYRRKECHYRVSGWRLEYAVPGHLCVRSSYYLTYPGHNVDMELRGQRSVFGFNVSSMRHRADLGPAQY